MKNREVVHKLSQTYTRKGLDLMEAIKIWNKEGMTVAQIRSQVTDDIGSVVDATVAAELHHLGTAAQHDSTMIAEPYKVSAGREDLIPEAVKNREVIRFTNTVKRSMVRVGPNLFRTKTARKYWTVKEKRGGDGENTMFLVAVDEPDELKEANQE